MAFGGVTREVLFDNMKTVVLERNTYGRGVHRFHAGFLDYAKHAGSCRDCANRIGPRPRMKLNSPYCCFVDPFYVILLCAQRVARLLSASPIPSQPCLGVTGSSLAQRPPQVAWA